jgi:hypothetical protein
MGPIIPSYYLIKKYSFSFLDIGGPFETNHGAKHWWVENLETGEILRSETWQNGVAIMLISLVPLPGKQPMMDSMISRCGLVGRKRKSGPDGGIY